MCAKTFIVFSDGKKLEYIHCKTIIRKTVYGIEEDGSYPSYTGACWPGKLTGNSDNEERCAQFQVEIAFIQKLIEKKKAHSKV